MFLKNTSFITYQKLEPVNGPQLSSEMFRFTDERPLKRIHQSKLHRIKELHHFWLIASRHRWPSKSGKPPTQWQTRSPFASCMSANDKLLLKRSTCKARIQTARFILTGKPEHGSSAWSCQAKLTQTLNGTEVAVGENRGIPCCISSPLSKLYYLGHGLLQGCQSLRTNHRSNNPYLPSLATQTITIPTNNEL